MAHMILNELDVTNSSIPGDVRCRQADNGAEFLIMAISRSLDFQMLKTVLEATHHQIKSFVTAKNFPGRFSD